MPETPMTLASLLHPVDVREFLDKHWERQFLHGAAPARAASFGELFSIRDVDRWLATARTGAPDGVVVASADGRPNDGQRKYRPGDIAVEVLYDAFVKGSSIVINRLEDSWAPIRPLVEDLGRFFCAEVGVNVYLTPKGMRAFPLHADDHDVFVLQVDGEKTWTLHELKVTPVNPVHVTFAKEIAYTADWGSGRVQTPVIAERTLKPGDVLYVPRGMPHCARATDVTSLHLTISVTPLYWIDFLKAAVEQAHVHVSGLRRALPPRFVEDQEARERMRDEFAAALRAFADHASFDETLDMVTRNRVRVQGFPPDGHFAQLESLHELTLQSVLRRRDSILCMVESPYNFSNIRFGTRHVRGPLGLRRALEFVRDTEQFAVDEIPGLEAQGKIVLATRLIREGLLRFVGEARS
jgi:ribosomal protein L16 Arg81 hydroxylase